MFCGIGFIRVVASEEQEPSDVFIGSVTKATTKYFHEGKEISQNRARDLYTEHLSREPVYEKAWDPDSGEPPQLEKDDGVRLDLPIKYEVSIQIEKTILGSIEKESTISWESSYGCFCRVFEDRSLEGGRFLWITNPEKKEKRGRFIPIPIDSDEAKSWILKLETNSANKATHTTSANARLFHYEHLKSSTSDMET